MRYRFAALVMALGLAAGPLVHAQQDVKEIALKDGSTLLVFKDGKMSMRDARGRVHGMKDGVAMETKNGQVIMMKGNEVWRRTSSEKLWEELYRGGN